MHAHEHEGCTRRTASVMKNVAVKSDSIVLSRRSPPNLPRQLAEDTWEAVQRCREMLLTCLWTPGVWATIMVAGRSRAAA